MTKEHYNVYIGQGGNNMTAVMTREGVAELQRLLHEGRPFGIWIRQDKGRLTGFTVSPRAGGVILSISPALRIPLRKDGAVAQNQAEVDRWLEPHEQPQGELVEPDWDVLPMPRERARPRVVPEQQGEEPEAAPPPGPPRREQRDQVA